MKKALQTWDGKSTDDLVDLYNKYCNTPSFANKITQFISDPHLQLGATWLLKYYLTQGNSLNTHQVKSIYQSSSLLQSWEAKLHVLQSIGAMPIAQTEQQVVEVFLRACLADNNKFVRTWAYNGFYELAKRYPEYGEEVKQLFELALRDESAAVKARIRNIMKKDSTTFTTQ